MFAQESILDRCDYMQLSNNVHKFVFNESSPEAVDMWFDLMEAIYRNSQPGQCIRILVDSSEIDVQPLKYVSQRARELNASFPTRPGTRTAFLYRTNFLASLARTFIIMFSRVGIDKVQFFPGFNREADAIDWLLTGN